MPSPDQIRERLPLSWLVERSARPSENGPVYTRLTREIGPHGEQWWGECPFCEIPRSREALTVIDSCGVFSCSECGRAGNHMSFLVHMGFSFSEAEEWLDEIAGEWQPVGGNHPVTRANGNTFHSMSPGGIEFTLPQETTSLNGGEAGLLAAIVTCPMLALEHSEALIARKLSERVERAIDVLMSILSEAPTGEALMRSSVRPLLDEAWRVCHQRGLTAEKIAAIAVDLIKGK